MQAGRLLAFAVLLAAAGAFAPTAVAAQARQPQARQPQARDARAARRPPRRRAAEHTVRAGETLSGIARQHRVNAFDLARANRLRPERTLRPGTVLTIPAGDVTYVRPRQTLADIARAHECEVDELMRLNGLRPGRPLRVGQRIELPTHEPAELHAADVDPERDWGPTTERGLARIHRRGELVRVRLLDEQGRVTREGLTRVGELMRRRDDDPAELPHPRLVRLLAAISDHFGGRPISLVSGRRAAGGATRETSRHVSGQATDIRVEGVPQRALFGYCRSLAHTGCGYYPRSTFVHVDVREQAAQWVDWSQPGRRAAYGNMRGPWARTCTRARRGPVSPRCAREGRTVTRPNVVPATVDLTPGARELMPVTPALAPGEEPEGEEAQMGHGRRSLL